MTTSAIKFSKDHLWAVDSGDSVKIGITEYFQDTLGEVIEVSLPEADIYIDAGDTLAEIESDGITTELISPLSGSIMNVNERVFDDPEIINVDPYGRGWLVEIEPSVPLEIESLMDEEEYEDFIEE